jgi:NTE family protein
VSDAPRVALVLGGGGFPAMAFHVGTLLALEHDLGWDASTADVVVGTSAGSVIAALLRSGVSTEAMMRWMTGAPASVGGRRDRAAIERVDEVGLRWRRPAWWSSRVRSLSVRSLWSAGVLDASRALRELAEVVDGWPERTLLVPAVRIRDGRRVVFGRDARPGVLDAVAASAAVPPVFRPIALDGGWYVDGGLSSPTNADVVLDEHVDVVVVLSAMTIRRDATSSRHGPELPWRAFARRRLECELATLRRAGVATVVFEPRPATLRGGGWSGRGWSGLSRRRLADVAQAAFLAAFDGIDRRSSAGLAVLASPAVAGQPQR